MVQDIRVKRGNEEEQTSLEDLLLALKTGSASRKEQARIHDFLSAVIPFAGAAIRLPYALGQVGWFITGGPVEKVEEEEVQTDALGATSTVIDVEPVELPSPENV